MGLTVPRFLVRPEGEFPDFIRQSFGPLPMRIRGVSATLALCEDGSRCNADATLRSLSSRRPVIEPVGVEAFIAQTTVEGLKECVAGWLSRAREVKRDRV